MDEALFILFGAFLEDINAGSQDLMELPVGKAGELEIAVLVCSLADMPSHGIGGAEVPSM